MKSLNVWFTDKEHKDLVRVKDGKTWHDFIMELADAGKNKI